MCIIYKKRSLKMLWLLLFVPSLALSIELDDPAFWQLNENSKEIVLSAIQNINNGRFNEALKVLDTVEDYQKNTPEFLHLRSSAHAGTGNHESMERDLRAAISLKTNYLPARFALVRFAIASGDQNTAKTQLDALITLAESESDKTTLKGLNEQYAFVTQATENGEELPPLVLEKSEDVIQAARLLVQQDETGASIKLLESWVKGRPQDFKVRMALAQAYTRLDRNDEALAEYGFVLEMDSSNAVALNNSAWLQRDINPDTSLLSIRKAIDLAPEDVRIRLTAAKIELASGDKVIARQHLKFIIQLDNAGQYKAAKNEAEHLLKSMD